MSSRHLCLRYLSFEPVGKRFVLFFDASRQMIAERIEVLALASQITFPAFAIDRD